MKPTEQGEVARDALAAIMREYRHLMGEETPEIRAALEALSHPVSTNMPIAEAVAWLRELAGNCQGTAANLYRDDDSDEAAEEWRVRGESYAFIADQIERGHSPLSTITASSTTEVSTSSPSGGMDKQ